MWNNFLEELQRKWDYSIALIDEISADISKLNEYPASTLTNKLDEINVKLDYARSQWINVDKLDNQVLDFRILSFFRNIDKKIDDINIKWDFFNTDLSKIDEEYELLKKEESTDKEKMSEKMNELKMHVLRWQLLFKVNDLKNSWWTSVYNIEDIQEDYFSLKEKWVDVSEIEKILFEL
jgi:hypothetical protein